MSETHTIRVHCNAAYADGTFLFEEEQLTADTSLRLIPPTASGAEPIRQYQMVDLRIVVPRAKAEEFLNGLRSGRVELDIACMKSEVEQAA